MSICVSGFLAGCGAESPPFTSREAPTESTVHQMRGIASYYSEEFQGHKTSSGETYDMNAFTAAHRTLPFNTRVRVTNLENKKSVVVRVNDRGPFKDDRVIDVSLSAARKLGLMEKGTALVRLEVIDRGR